MSFARFIAAGFVCALIAGWMTGARAADHQVVRRLVVFPVLVPPEYRPLAEEVWWDVRGRLTEGKRFLMASRNFLEAKGVFEARAALNPADAIILGRLLDAHSVVTMALDDRELTLRAYDGRDGQGLWQRSILLQSGVPLSKQLGSAAEKLVLDFIAAIPYQGFVVVDPLVGRATYMEGDSMLVRVDVGTDAQLKSGDPVELVVLNQLNTQPLFGDGGALKVVAQGVIEKIEGATVTVKVNRLADGVTLKEGTLVRFPDELKRLQDTYLMSASKMLSENQVLSDSVRKLTPEQEARRPLVTALSFILNMAVVLLLGL
jgi:hypothetical protein